MIVLFDSVCYRKIMQSVHITTNVVSSYPTHDEVYSMQHYVTQVGGFFVGDFFGGGRATHFKKLVLNGK